MIEVKVLKSDSERYIALGWVRYCTQTVGWLGDNPYDVCWLLWPERSGPEPVYPEEHRPLKD